jgi:hypothetical protein
MRGGSTVHRGRPVRSTLATMASTILDNTMDALPFIGQLHANKQLKKSCEDPRLEEYERKQLAVIAANRSRELYSQIFAVSVGIGTFVGEEAEQRCWKEELWRGRRNAWTRLRLAGVCCRWRMRRHFLATRWTVHAIKRDRCVKHERRFSARPTVSRTSRRRLCDIELDKMTILKFTVSD